MTLSTPKAPSRVVLGVTGGIAAYKSVDLLRRLRDAGYAVSPILTPDATRFVGTVTFAALSSEPVRVSLYGDATTPIPHTALGQGADLIVVAPATAHFIARYALGLADDLLSATVLATRAPVLLCPAMHTEMWEQPSVQENLATLRRRGVQVLGPDVGHLAGGDQGAGRMVEPEVIAEVVASMLSTSRSGVLAGRRVVVTAGGTREPIDPVRVLSNRSSGRQGHAIAEVAARLGADVELITTASLPLALDVVRSIDVTHVETTEQMADAVFSRAPKADVVVMAAAVADFHVSPQPTKMKRKDGVPQLVLSPTIDILAGVVRDKPDGQVVVGFAAESENATVNGLEKARAKHCDLLVVNDVSRDGVGFDHETNEVLLIDRHEVVTNVSFRSKSAVAFEILSRVATMLERGES